MSVNKETVETYIEGFRQGDHSKILGCLTDDVSWEMPGHFSRTGKDEFDAEIENEGFVGRPDITIHRMVEEGDVVAAEGTVTHERTSGASLSARFCDVFQMREGKIVGLTSYLVPLGAGS